MAVRNFYVNGYVTGRETPITGGPRSLDGGMNLNLTIRENGSISNTVIKINCYRDSNNKNHVTIFEDIKGGHCNVLYDKLFDA